jgi:hypothetical protein
MQILKCPHCDLDVSPKNDGACPSCGFDVSRALTQTEKEQIAKNQIDLAVAQQYERANEETSRGCFLIVIAALVTAGTYGAARSLKSPTGGLYLALWGPLLAGVALLIRGVFRSVFKR